MTGVGHKGVVSEERNEANIELKVCKARTWNKESMII